MMSGSFQRGALYLSGNSQELSYSCGVATLHYIARKLNQESNLLSVFLSNMSSRSIGLYISELLRALDLFCRDWIAEIPGEYFPELFFNNKKTDSITSGVNLALSACVGTQREAVYDNLKQLLRLNNSKIIIPEPASLSFPRSLILLPKRFNLAIINGTCNEMYGILDEDWGHYIVVEREKDGKWHLLFDPYEDMGIVDYGEKWSSFASHIQDLKWLDVWRGAWAAIKYPV